MVGRRGHGDEVMSRLGPIILLSMQSTPKGIRKLKSNGQEDLGEVMSSLGPIYC